VQEAERMLQKSLAIYRELLGDSNPGLGEVRLSLGSVYYVQGRYREAEEIDRKAMTNWLPVLSEDHPGLVRCVNNLAAILAAQGKNADAETLLRRAVEIRSKVYPPGHPEVISSLQSLTKRKPRADGRSPRCGKAEGTRIRKSLTCCRT
jgi:tetratricopeptide (TPR) repeat protein